MIRRAAPAKAWAIYIRVSTEEQAEHGVSLKAQRASCSAYLQAHGLPVGMVIEDAGHSAKNLHRPGMQQLLEAIRDGTIAGVVAWKLDRLSRSVRDLWDVIERAEAAQVAVACVTEKIDTSGPFGRFAVTMMGAIAQLEREQIAERVTSAIRHIKSKGGFHGGRVPTGFRPEGAKGARRLVLDQVVGAKLAPLWPMLANGASLRDLAAYLNKELKTMEGKPWAVNTIADLLRNEKYVGPVVTREDFDRAIAALGDRWSPRKAAAGATSGTLAGGRKPKRLYVLSQLAYCLHCGAALTGVYSTGRNGPVYYYRCASSLQRGGAGCKARQLPAEHWERVVFQAIAAALNDEPQIAEAWEAKAAEHRKHVGPLEAERVDLVKKRDALQVVVERLVGSLEAGGAAARAVQLQLEKRQTELESLDLLIAGIDGRLAAAAVAEGNVVAAVELLQPAILELADAPPEDQQRGLRMMVKRVGLAADIPRIELDLIIDVPAVGATGRPRWRTKADAGRTGQLALTVALTLKPRGRRAYPAPEIAARRSRDRKDTVALVS